MLRLTGHVGADERRAYLRALADDVLAGRCGCNEAVAELEELSVNWLREVVRRRVRQLPPYADAHATEHWIWVEWHASLQRFDPHRVDTFPAYVALRIRMAAAAAAREEDALSRGQRARVKSFEQAADALMQTLGRTLRGSEECSIRTSLGDAPDDWHGDWRSSPNRDLTPAGSIAQDPADAVVRHAIATDVRAIIGSSGASVARHLLHWLEGADGHDRHPPRRLTSALPGTIRLALAPLRLTG